MPPRFPTRYRDGFIPEAAGTAAYLRRAAGGDWQKKTTVGGDAVVSREGLFVNVRGQPQGLTRMYMLGFDNASGKTHVYGSPDSRKWRDLGPAALFSTDQKYAPPLQATSRRGVATLLNTGPAFGYLGGGVITPYSLDKFGLRWWDTDVTWLLTPRGIAPTDLNYLIVEQPIGWPAYQQIADSSTYPTDDSPDYMQQVVEDAKTPIKLLPAGYRDIAGTPTWYAGFAAIEYRAAIDHAVHAFYSIDSVSFGVGATVVLDDAAPLATFLNTLSPGRILKLDTFYYPQKQQHADHDADLTPEVPWHDMPRTPLALVSHSTDGGNAWTQVAAPLIQDEVDDVFDTLDDYSYYKLSRAITSDADASLIVSAGAAPVQVWTAPLSRTLSVAVAAVPYAIGDDDYSWRVKMGTVGTDGVMAGSTVLDAGAGDFRGRALVKHVLALKGEVLIVLRDTTDAIGQPASILSTVDGTTTAPRGVMPAAENFCGPIMAVRSDLLLVTVYSGGTAKLYRSTDRAATWEEHATISDTIRAQPGGVVPDHLTDLALIEVDGEPQSAYPATPWLTDCRIEHE